MHRPGGQAAGGYPGLASFGTAGDPVDPVPEARGVRRRCPSSFDCARLLSQLLQGVNNIVLKCALRYLSVLDLSMS